MEPRPPSGIYEGMAMAHGLLPDGRIGNDGVPYAISKPEWVQLLAGGKSLPQPLLSHEHTKFCGGIRLIVDQESESVIASLGGNDDEGDDA